jgi:hypothetical protein
MVRVRSRSPLLAKSEGGRFLWQAVGRWNGITILLLVVLGLMLFVSSLNVSFLDGIPLPSKYSSNSPEINYESTNDEQCRFYIAESALPHSGLGVFTTIPLAKGDMSQSMPDICIYVADTPKRGTHFETHSWSRDAWYGTWEGGNPRSACEGVATLFNSMPPGVQTSKLHMLHPPDHGEIRRSRDPNAGAITHYTGISSVATRKVKAGSEITIDYQEYVSIVTLVRIRFLLRLTVRSLSVLAGLTKRISNMSRRRVRSIGFANTVCALITFASTRLRIRPWAAALLPRAL